MPVAPPWSPPRQVDDDNKLRAVFDMGSNEGALTWTNSGSLGGGGDTKVRGCAPVASAEALLGRRRHKGVGAAAAATNAPACLLLLLPKRMPLLLLPLPRLHLPPIHPCACLQVTARMKLDKDSMQQVGSVKAA